VSTYCNSFLRRGFVPSLRMKSRAQFCKSSLSRSLFLFLGRACLLLFSYVRNCANLQTHIHQFQLPGWW